MKVSVLPGQEIGPDLVSHWRRLQASDVNLASPYFCPEFTQAVADVRDDVFVAVIEDAGDIRAFFPFQRGRFGQGKPVGGPLCDFQGIVMAPGTEVDLMALMRACGLTSFDFHMLLASQVPFAPFHQAIADSHFIDLSNGYEGYQQAIQQHSANLLKEMRTKRAKLDKSFADVRFEAHCPDLEPLRVMFAWKEQQYHESGLVNVFGFPWTRALLERIHGIQTPTFSGMLSTVRLDGVIVAVHMGMRSSTVWNWWFPRHDEAYYKYSPGMLLRMYAAQVAADFGVRRIDLGQGGPNTYKPRVRTGGIPLAAGRVEVPSLVNTLRHASLGLEAGIRKSPLMPLVRWPGRIIKRMGRAARFR